MSRKRPDLFDGVLEDDLGGRPAAAKQRLGGAALRADEFAQPRAPEELDSRFSLLQHEERAMRSQREHPRATRRVRWRGTLWLLGGLVALCLAVLGWFALERVQSRAEQATMARANAERKKAEEDRLLRLQQTLPPAAAKSAASAH